jgi:hypothetical protein
MRPEQTLDNFRTWLFSQPDEHLINMSNNVSSDLKSPSDCGCIMLQYAQHLGLKKVFCTMSFIEAPGTQDILVEFPESFASFIRALLRPHSESLLTIKQVKTEFLNHYPNP